MYQQAVLTARPGYLKSRADSRFLSGISHFGLSPNINPSVICCLRANSTHQLPAAFLLCSLTTNMFFPYLSPTPPENKRIHSDVQQLTGSMNGNLTPPWFSPSRPESRTEVSLSCDASMLRRELPRVYHRPPASSLSGRLLHLP